MRFSRGRGRCYGSGETPAECSGVTRSRKAWRYLKVGIEEEAVPFYGEWWASPQQSVYGNRPIALLICSHRSAHVKGQRCGLSVTHEPTRPNRQAPRARRVSGAAKVFERYVSARAAQRSAAHGQYAYAPARQSSVGAEEFALSPAGGGARYIPSHRSRARRVRGVSHAARQRAGVVKTQSRVK